MSRKNVNGGGEDLQKQIATMAEDLKSRNFKKISCKSSNNYDAVLQHVCMGIKAESLA